MTQYNDYKTQFNEDTTALIDANIEDRTERMAAVQALIDRYVETNGEIPDRAQLERLSDYILREELTNPNRMKVRDEEYPFLSARQLERRQDYEYSIDLAESYDTDGTNCAKPERRHRTAKEQRFIDKVAQAKNRRRNAQYKRDTSTVTTAEYNLHETGGELTEPFVQCRGLGERWAAGV